jgi:glycosyltransferase involved in cell wall biosynthesis/ribosomal protein S18 acetylase RimI-like enzyme
MEGGMSRPLRIAHVTTVDLTQRFLLLGQLRRLRDEGFEVTAISAPGPWVPDIEAEGIRHVAWRSATRSWNPRQDVRAFAELVRIFRRERFDLVHTHNPKPGVLGRVAARVAGVPCVMNTVHGLYATPDDPLRRRLPVMVAERLAALFSDLELFQSEEDLQWASRAGVVPAEKSVLLGNGADLTKFGPDLVDPADAAALRVELGIPKSALVVGTVGRLVAEKGYREFFAAARSIRSRAPEVRFVALGADEPDKGDAIARAEVDAARADVIFAGWRIDVPTALAIMDVFVLASWREGIPRSAIEAAAMAKAMVLTDIRGCREVARHGVEGLLVAARDARALEASVQRLLDDPGLRAGLGGAARTRAVALFDERRVADEVSARSRALLERRGLIPLAGADGVRIRSATKRDAPALARLHFTSMPDAFLPSLGEPFLRQLYTAMISDRAGAAVVAENGAGIVGFAAGTISVRDFYRRFFVRRGVRAAVAAGPKLLGADVRRRARETASYPSVAEGLPAAELLSIAVDHDVRTRGIGLQLANTLVERLAAIGAPEVKVVVGSDNEPANRLYRTAGFSPRASISVHDGRTSNVWVIRCRS